MLVAGCYIHQMAGLQRTDMRRNNLVGDRLLLIAADDSQDEARGNRCRKRGAHSKSAEERPPGRFEKATHRDDARRWRRERRFDPTAQIRRCDLLQRGAGHGLAHSAERSELLGAIRTGRRMRFHLAGVPGVELAVDQRVKQNFGFGAVHSAIPEAAADPGLAVAVSAVFQAERSMARARANRDMTVPTGTPATSAISL